MRTFIFAILIITSTACAKAAESSPAPEEECPQSLGTWFFGKCECNSDQKLVENNGQYSCQENGAFKSCLETEGGFTYSLNHQTADQFNSCFTFKNKVKSEQGLISPNYKIETRDAKKTEKRKLASWADKNKSVLTSLASWPSATHQGELLVLTDKPAVILLESVLRPFQMPIIPVANLDGLIAPKIFADSDALTSFLENPAKKQTLSPDVLSFDPRGTALADIYQSDFSKDLKVSKASSVFGCLAGCQRMGPIVNSGAYQGQYKEYVIENRVYRSEIVLTDSNGNVVATLYLAGKQVSLLVLIERDQHGLPVKATFHSGKGSFLADLAIPSISASKLLALREEFIESQFDATRPSTTVVVCENNFNLQSLKQKGYLENFSFGPHSDSSFFGWVEGTNSLNYWNSAIFQNDLGMPYALDDYATHSQNVTETLLAGQSGKNIAIAPLGVAQCLDLDYVGKIWSTLKSDEKLRVINISASNEIDDTQCMAGIHDHPVVTDPDVLWVIAAGNAGLFAPQTCPQFLSGFDNVIIVGATEDGHLHSTSNKGNHFVDVAAPGDAKSGDFGTSFATPKISSLAAEIFSRYPDLKAPQVKLAILLGAKSNSGWNLDVRSGGELNRQRALKYAYLLSQEKSAENAIRSVECGSAFQDCYQSDHKLKLYNQFK